MQGPGIQGTLLRIPLVISVVNHAVVNQADARDVADARFGTAKHAGLLFNGGGARLSQAQRSAQGGVGARRGALKPQKVQQRQPSAERAFSEDYSRYWNRDKQRAESTEFATCLCLSRGNALRRRALDIAATPQFDWLMIFVVLVSCVEVTLETPPSGTAAVDSAFYVSPAMAADLDLLFVAIFAAEFLLKIVANGFFTPTYLGDVWNRFDFLVLLSMVYGSVAHFLLYRGSAKVKESTIGVDARLIRLVRVMRPLRLVKSNPNSESCPALCGCCQCCLSRECEC